MEFTNFEQIIIMYAPVVLVYITQIVDWIVSLKKFKSLNLSLQLAPLKSSLKKNTDAINDLKKEVQEFNEEKADLKSAIADLKACIDVKNDKLEKMNECLNNLSKENVELKAALRRKSECVVKEPENV